MLQPPEAVFVKSDHRSVFVSRRDHNTDIPGFSVYPISLCAVFIFIQGIDRFVVHHKIRIIREAVLRFDRLYVVHKGSYCFG